MIFQRGEIGLPSFIVLLNFVVITKGGRIFLSHSLMLGK